MLRKMPYDSDPTGKMYAQEPGQSYRPHSAKKTISKLYRSHKSGIYLPRNIYRTSHNGLQSHLIVFAPSKVIPVEVDSASRGLLVFQLGVNNDDDPKSVAAAFCQKHNLGPE